MIQKRREFIINFLYFTLIAISVYFIVSFATQYLMPFIIGFLIALILKPLIQLLKKWFGKKRWLAGIALIIFYIILGVLLFFAALGIVSGVEKLAKMLPGFYSDTLVPAGQEISNAFQGFIANLDPNIAQLLDKATLSLTTSLETFVRDFSAKLISGITGLASSLPSLLIAALTAIISSMFFALDYRKIVNTVLSIFPDKQRRLILEIKNHLVSVIGKYLRAYAILMSLTFVELSIGFTVLGIPNSIMTAFLVALVDVLPVLGTGTVMIPWVIIEFAIGDMNRAIGLAIVYGVVTVIRNILEPKIVGDQIGLHPVVTLMSIYAGTKLFGFAGLIGVPVVVTIIKSLHDDDKINIFPRKKKPEKTEPETIETSSYT